MSEYNAQTQGFDSPYRFNGKELDEETGLAYYGARYYDNQISQWLSVDRLAEKYPHSSPYVFSGNNPLTYVDPNGDSTVTTIVMHEGSGYYNSTTNTVTITGVRKIHHALYHPDGRWYGEFTTTENYEAVIDGETGEVISATTDYASIGRGTDGVWDMSGSVYQMEGIEYLSKEIQGCISNEVRTIRTHGMTEAEYIADYYSRRLHQNERERPFAAASNIFAPSTGSLGIVTASVDVLVMPSPIEMMTDFSTNPEENDWSAKWK